MSISSDFLYLNVTASYLEAVRNRAEMSLNIFEDGFGFTCS